MEILKRSLPEEQTATAEGQKEMSRNTYVTGHGLRVGKWTSTATVKSVVPS